MTLDDAWEHVQRLVEGHEQDGESVFDGEDLAALTRLGQFIDDHKGKMALTAEEVEVAYGVLVELREERRTDAVRGLSDRENKLAERMRVMLGSSADGERRV